MRVIAGGHRRAAHGRADAHVALAAGFAQLDVAVIQITNLADGGIAHLAHQANFAGGQADLGIIAFFGQQLSSSARGADQLAAFALLQLNIVDQRADRDIGRGQAVARANFGLGPDITLSPTFRPRGATI